MEVPSRADLKKLKVVELRQRLSKLSLPQGGVKEVLISRLIEYHEKQAQEQEEEQQDEQQQQQEEEQQHQEEQQQQQEEQQQQQEPQLEQQQQNGSPLEEEGAAMMVSIEMGGKDRVPGAVVASSNEMMAGPDLAEPEATPPEPVHGHAVTGQVEATPDVTMTSPMETTPPDITTPPDVTMTRPVETAPPVEPIETTPPGVTMTTTSVETAPPVETTPLDANMMTIPVETTPPVEPVETTPPDEPIVMVGQIETTPPDEPMMTTPPAESVVTTPPAEPVVTIPPAERVVTTPPAEPVVTTPPAERVVTTPPAEPVVTTPPAEPVMNVEYRDSGVELASPVVPKPLFPVTQKTAEPVMTTPPDEPVMNAEYRVATDSGVELASPVLKPLFPVTQKSAEPAKKAEKQKRKKKKRKRRRHDQPPAQVVPETQKQPEVEIEYLQENLLKPGDPNYRQFHKILEAFRIPEPEELEGAEPSTMSVTQLVAHAAEKSKMAAPPPESSSDEEEENKEEQKMSKKKLRKLNRLTVAQLKQLVDRPDVVEMHDVTAMDPKLLIHLKSMRNTVPVPRHWSYKRKYLQGKRGIEKPPFDLPDFIKATGVMEMRQAVEDKEDAKSLKQKTRERVRPKMGKLTIDYQKLHDAFFKWQTKPKMSIHGDMYYEGKEFETRLRQKKPGDLSEELRRSLGMPTGMGKQKFPPPWLVAMQRYGPPPSYPNLKIPGLNAPIPENCSFGYFVGGWGKPPVDEIGRPLYGDVFGLEQQEAGHVIIEEEEIDKSLWGELESEEEEEEEDEEESEEEGSPKPEDLAAGLVTPMEGLVTPSGLTSIPAGLETPDMIQLRKKKIEEAMEQGGETPALYTVIPEKTVPVGGAMMGSSHAYDVSTASVPAKKAGAIDVALDPSELDLDTATIAARYEEQVREKRNSIQKEDLSDMVAEHAAKQKKRKRPAADSAAGGKAAKKLKEFKF